VGRSVFRKLERVYVLFKETSSELSVTCPNLYYYDVSYWKHIKTNCVQPKYAKVKSNLYLC